MHELTAEYERTAYNGKLTYCRNLVAILEEEARQRREQLKELREKFLVSRKHRLMGKPYQRPAQKRTSSAPPKPSATSQQAAGVDLAMAVGPGIAGGSASVQSQAATVLLNAMNTNLSGLTPTSLVQPPVPAASIPPFASLTGGTFLSQSTNPLIASSLRQQLLLSNLGLRGSLMNPSLLDNRSHLLSMGLFGGFPTSQEITRQTLLAQIRSEDERIAMLQRLAALQNVGISTGAPQAVGNQEEKSDFANQQTMATLTSSPSGATQTEAVPQNREGQSRGAIPRGSKKRARDQP
jgi:hypothetical protein